MCLVHQRRNLGCDPGALTILLFCIFIVILQPSSLYYYFALTILLFYYFIVILQPSAFACVEDVGWWFPVPAGCLNTAMDARRPGQCRDKHSHSKLISCVFSVCGVPDSDYFAYKHSHSKLITCVFSVCGAFAYSLFFLGLFPPPIGPPLGAQSSSSSRSSPFDDASSGRVTDLLFSALLALSSVVLGWTALGNSTLALQCTSLVQGLACTSWYFLGYFMVSAEESCWGWGDTLSVRPA